MITQEMVNAVMQERDREVAELQRQRQAQREQEQAATPRGGLFTQRIRRLPLLSFVTRGFRPASVS